MSTPYFAYGTTQSGFLHHRALEPVLGAPVGRFRTVEAHGIVVPREAACSNPGCRFKHRMAALVRGHWNLHAEGDVFLAEDLAPLDALELSGPYTREAIDVVADDGRRFSAQAYPAAEPARWAQLVAVGLADAFEGYPRELADVSELKDCCVAAPGHEPPHDVLDPFDEVKLANQRLRNLALGFALGNMTSLHLLEATAGVTHTPFGREILFAVIELRDDRAALRSRIARVLEQR